MSLTALIRKRRSIRRFLDTPVEREKIMTCLEAARLAPSACNTQPWKFTIIDDKELKDRVCDAAFGGIYRMNAFARTAPVLVVVSSQKDKFIAGIGGMFRGTRYYLIDIGIACEHFVLQAEELGLGTCWIGFFNEKAVKKLLNIPSRVKLDIVIALGNYNRTVKQPAPARERIEKISSFNSY